LALTERFRPLVPMNGLPPKLTCVRPLVPSGKSDRTSTLAFGRFEYGEPYCWLPLNPMLLSLRSDFTYAVCVPVTPPFQLVRSPLWAGNSLVSGPAGVCRDQNPLKVTLKVCALLELGGLKSSDPNSDPLSLSRLLGARPFTSVGTCAWSSRSISRATESAEIPADWSPSGLVLSSE
jgi:hypothetical protein